MTAPRNRVRGIADLRESAQAAEPNLDEGPTVDPTDEILAKWAALGCVVWAKKIASSGEQCADNAFGDAELAFVSTGASAGRVRVIPHLWAGMYRASEHGNKRLAPTQKPIAVIAKPIEWYTRPGDLVIDWYCGSGTTLLASEKLGRAAYLMEITPRYVAVTLERAARAGLTPRRIG